MRRYGWKFAVIIFIALLAGIAGIAGWAVYTLSGKKLSSSPVEGAASVRVPEAAPTMPALLVAPKPKSILPAPAAPVREASFESSHEMLRESVPAVLLRARAGDIDAMFDLGRALRPCGEQAYSELVELAESLEAERREDDRREDDRREDDRRGDTGKYAVLGVRISDKLLPQTREKIAQCDAAPADERDRGFAWIERAADTGHPGARAYYYYFALREFEDDDAIVEHIDEIERRREVARRFAREDLAACTQDVFELISASFDLLGMTDPVERMAILHASVLSMRDADEAAFASATFDEEARAVDELALIEAKRRGAALYAHCAP